MQKLGDSMSDSSIHAIDAQAFCGKVVIEPVWPVLSGAHGGASLNHRPRARISRSNRFGGARNKEIEPDLDHLGLDLLDERSK